jgi:thiol-disulfide isomerase/thioredoxin
LSYRFSDKPERTSHNITGRYLIHFENEEEESKDAVGIFYQEGNLVQATMLTTTGDYRYLEGEMNGNRLWLSAFDGSHLFLFTGLVNNDSIYSGEFFSGMHWYDKWKGVKDENSSLISPDSLTKITDNDSGFDFNFPDDKGKFYSLKDSRFKNKPVIVQVMGTWCPNCMDETKFLSEWYNNQAEKKIEIIALSYERITDTATVHKNISRLKNRFSIQYPVVFAGSSDKKEAVKTLPALDRIFAFPTTIFLDRNKKVIKIHTGFNGPATGKEFEKFKKEFKELTEKMVTG